MIIGLLDSENAPNLAATWGIHDQSVRYTDIIQEWFFISIQYKILGERSVSTASILDDPKRFIKDHTDDYFPVKKAHEFLQTVDVIVGHNIKGHDLKKLEAKFIEHNLPPIDMPFIVDTLQWSKKFGFTSRKLKDLCTKLGLQHKLEHEAGIFIGAAQGDVKSIRSVVRYGIGDIPTLEELYLKLRPYSKHPNQNLFKKYPCCPKCASVSIHKRGLDKTGANQTYACGDCKARFYEKIKTNRVKFK